jgi:hypothetical protein
MIERSWTVGRLSRRCAGSLLLPLLKISKPSPLPATDDTLSTWQYFSIASARTTLALSSSTALFTKSSTGMTDRTNEFSRATDRARAVIISNAHGGASQNITPRCPVVTIRTYDGLAVDTQVEYGHDGSVVVSIYKYRPTSANVDGSPPAASVELPQRTGDAQHHRHLALPADVLGGFVFGGGTPVQQSAENYEAARADLPRSNRVWDFGNPVELHEMNAVNPATPPPTYEEATFTPPPYEHRVN